LPGCKSQEEKNRDHAAQAFAEAAKQMVQASKDLTRDRAAKGADQGAEGAEQVAAGVKTAAQAMKNWAQAMKNAPQGGNSGDPGAVIEPVNFRDLKALLPESVGTSKRSSSSGEKSGITGLTISQAKASYDSDGGKRLRIKLIDTGGTVAPMAMAAFGLAMVEIDREDDNGYERTSTVNGNKVLEKWNSKKKHGEYKVFVANRFIVDVEGDLVTMDELKAAVAALDLSKLAALGQGR